MAYLIGMYDSGVGGMTVSQEVIKAAPHCNLIYLGDTMRVPYGDKTEDEIICYSREITLFLIEKGADVIVVACNTSSAMALPVIKNDISIPIIGMIEPGVKAAVSSTKNGRFGVIATNNTIKSRAYEKAIKRLIPEAYVAGVGCPTLVPLVESGETKGEKVRSVLLEYLEVMKRENVDTLIYGCTHYPFLETEIRAILGDKVNLVDPAKAVAKEIETLVTACGNADDSRGIIECFVTGDAGLFGKNASFLTNTVINRVEHISLSTLESYGFRR